MIKKDYKYLVERRRETWQTAAICFCALAAMNLILILIITN